MSELSEIRAILLDQTRTLGRIEGDCSSMNKSIADMKQEHEKLNTRVGKVEGRVNRWAGGLTVISAFISASVAWMIKSSQGH